MNSAKLVKVKELFRLAEQRCKIVESRVDFSINSDYRTGLAVPTINQLRYAGFHVLEYVTTDKEYHLDEAESHCKRAIYDIFQIELLYYLMQRVFSLAGAACRGW